MKNVKPSAGVKRTKVIEEDPSEDMMCGEEEENPSALPSFHSSKRAQNTPGRC